MDGQFLKLKTQDYNKVIYRQAVASDTIDLLSLVQEYCQEFGLQYDNKSIKKYLDTQIGMMPTIVCDNDGEVIGAISFVLIPDPFKNENLIAKKIACFVTSNYRGENIGSELRQKAEQICKQQGVKKFYFSGTDQVPGYEVFETEYVKEL